jgi:hypothetical protein
MTLLEPVTGPAEVTPRLSVSTTIGIAEICASTGVSEGVACDEFLRAIECSYILPERKLTACSRETGEEIPIDELEGRKDEAVVSREDLAKVLGRRFPTLCQALNSDPI